MTFGETLYTARRRARMSQDEIADALGVTRQSVSHWEHDKTLPDLERGLRLIRILDIDPEVLFVLPGYLDSLSVTGELVAA